MTAHSEKALLRSQMRKWLRSRSPEFTREASARIQKHLANLRELQDAKNILVFSAMETEPSLALAVDDWLRGGKQLYFPRVIGEAMEIREITNRSDLHPGAFGILEPDPDRCPISNVAEMEVVLTPGIAFARNGARLGQGGGFYDRMFAEKEFVGRPIGICFSHQLVERLPVESHDVFMETLVSEIGVHEVANET